MSRIPAYDLPVTIKGEEYVKYCLHKDLVNEQIREIDKLEDRVRELEEELSVKRREERIEYLENRHQSDCITINQLHTAIDVLVDKLSRLREVHGL